MSSQPSSQVLGLAFPQACVEKACDLLEHEAYRPSLLAVLRSIDA